MGMYRTMITRCLDYNSWAPALATSAWFDLP